MTRDEGEAFAEFAARQLDAAYRLAALIVGDSSDAQDATHDAFLAAWRNWSTLRDPERVDAWFQRILVNTCRNALRRSKRRRILDVSDELRAVAAPGDISAEAADRDAVGRAFGRLSADHRICLVLRYYERLTVDEIAERTGVPAATVKSRIHVALRQAGVTLAEPAEVTT
ncbi:MAG TPA: sigma-70 family RNA polymerase sigma factor [Candidatus Limnocylindrales bacterium]|nr:sigma-70 family RNA polymerase sigma factor [Candidatus Limnocylindrales bacterium]